MQRATAFVIKEEAPKQDANSELITLMADLILKVMKETKGHCGIASLLKEMRAIDAKFTYGDIITNWYAANLRAEEEAKMKLRQK